VMGKDGGVKYIQLGHDDELVAGDTVFLNRFGYNLLADTVGVDVGGIPSVEALVIGILEQRKCLERISFASRSG
jgi:hypothetical protein